MRNLTNVVADPRSPVAGRVLAKDSRPRSGAGAVASRVGPRRAEERSARVPPARKPHFQTTVHRKPALPMQNAPPQLLPRKASFHSLFCGKHLARMRGLFFVFFFLLVFFWGGVLKIRRKRTPNESAQLKKCNASGACSPTSGRAHRQAAARKSFRGGTRAAQSCSRPPSEGTGRNPDA